MNRHISLLSAALLAIGLGCAVPVVHAADEQPESSSRVKRAQTLRPEIYKQLDAARTQADAKQYNQALQTLQSLEKRKRNSYETAMTYNMFAYVYFNQENYNGAIKAYENVLAVENLPDSLRQTTLYSVAKLYLMQEQYQKALKPLNQWFEVVEQPGAEAFMLRAQVYYQLEQYKSALPDIRKAITMTTEQGNVPRENWLMLERAVYYQNKDFRSLAGCLQNLIGYYPKGTYWVQLAAVYNELNQPMKELSTLETAYEQGFLTQESELISFAQALMAQEIPFKAAQVLDKAIKEGKIKEDIRVLSTMGDAWMLAREYDQAITVMTQVAKLSGAGKDYFRLAQIHTERQEWDLALKNVNAAIEKGGLPQGNSAYVLKGLVLFNMDHLADAKNAFAKASSDGNRSAAQWIEFIENEEKRREYMAASS